MVLFIYIKLFLCYYNRIKTELVSQVLGGKMGIFTKYNLFDSFDDYGKNEVLEAISSLSEEEQNILRKRFGDDYTGNKIFLFSTTDNIIEIYSEILPKIKKIIIDNRKNKEFDPQELIPCINSGFSNKYMCNKFNLTRQELYKELSKYFSCSYDESGSIGKRYRRNDAIGTPFSITIDDETINNNTVTIRDRDTMELLVV